MSRKAPSQAVPGVHSPPSHGDYPIPAAAVVVVVAAAAGLTIASPHIWAFLLMDLLLVGAVLLAAAGLGAWPAAWCLASHGADRVDGAAAVKRFCVALPFGWGILGALTLALGMAGWMSRPVALALLAAGAAAGISYLGLRGGMAAQSSAASVPHRPRPFSFAAAVRPAALLLPLAIPLGIALFGASLPPGLIWTDEARGYDALEYHLQAPREYFEAGRIEFLPHNVYASFPQQVEILYYLLMHLAGSPHEAGSAAQLLHMMLGVLAVVALAAWSPPGRGRLVVALLAGGCAWLAYAGCLAYVENGVLLCAAVAAGLIRDEMQAPSATPLRMTLAAGVCAGLAAGCKYTAIALVPVALGLSWLIVMQTGMATRLLRFALFGAAALAAFSPWMIRNALHSGNPVYPFAYSLLGGRAWSAEQDAQWRRGHTLPEADRPLPARLRIAARELFGTLRPDAPWLSQSLFGYGLFLVAAAGALAGGRDTRLLILWAVLMLGVWIGATHVPGRFVVPLIVPLALLAGDAFRPGAEPAPARHGDAPPPAARLLLRLRGALLVVAVLSALHGGLMLIGELVPHATSWKRTTNVSLSQMLGRWDVLRDTHPYNAATPPDARLWLVGDAAVFYVDRPMHYTVVFSRDPWLELAASGADAAACVEWLRTQNVTHVIFSWDEIRRLAATYGFPEVVTKAWVARLAAAGLRLVESQRRASGATAYEVYEVPSRDVAGSREAQDAE